MCKVFLGVLMGVDGHVEDGGVWKLDLQTLRLLHGGYEICWWDVRNGWPTAQLPFLAFGILQPAGSLEGSTHFGMLPINK